MSVSHRDGRCSPALQTELHFGPCILLLLLSTRRCMQPKACSNMTVQFVCRYLFIEIKWYKMLKWDDNDRVCWQAWESVCSTSHWRSSPVPSTYWESAWMTPTTSAATQGESQPTHLWWCVHIFWISAFYYYMVVLVFFFVLLYIW